MRSEKQLLLDDIQDRINSSEMTLAFSYQNMNANLNSDFRDAIALSGGSIYTIKKRVLIKAAGDAGLKINLKDLEGHIALLFSDPDHAISSTKALYKFLGENKETVNVLCGRFQGQLCHASDFEKISKLPTQNEMRSELLSIFEAPMAQTMSVMEALLTSIMHCLENKVSQV